MPVALAAAVFSSRDISLHVTHQQVLGLDVAVGDAQLVKVGEGAGQVVQHAARVPFGVARGRRDGVEEVASLVTVVKCQQQQQQQQWGQESLDQPYNWVLDTELHSVEDKM